MARKSGFAHVFDDEGFLANPSDFVAKGDAAGRTSVECALRNGVYAVSNLDFR